MRLDSETGYLTDVPYTAGFYGELAPVHLDYVAAVRGADPVQLEGGFRYCELGCGRGFGLNVLAASNPDGEFHGIDFMPGHIAEGTRLARQGRLSNVTFHEATFAEAGSLDLPQFDFVVLHGVYSWASPAARDEIVEFIRRRLRPGGIAYISYNAMPGWAPVMPLRRLLVERAATLPGNGAETASAAVEWLKGLFALEGGQYVKANPRIKQFLDGLAGKPLNYIAHEFLHEHWVPFWFGEVRDDMARARLDYIGDAVVVGNYPELTLPAAWISFLDGPGKPVDSEMQKDFLLNVQFRKDVFGKGVRRAEAGQRFEMLQSFHYLTRQATLSEELTFTALKLKTAPIHQALFDAAKAGGLQSGDLARIAVSQKVNFGAAMGALQSMVAANILQPARHAGIAAEAKATPPVLSSFNAVVLEQAIAARQLAWLASPVTGSGFVISTIESVILAAMIKNPAIDAAKLQDEMQRRNVSISSDGKAVTEPAALAELLNNHLSTFRATTLPALRIAGVVGSSKSGAAPAPRLGAVSR